MLNFEAEDILLLAGVVTLLTVSIAEAAHDSTIYKGVKILALLISLYLAWDRIRTSRPYWRDVKRGDWTKLSGREYELRLTRREHRRGRTPFPRAMAPESDGFAEVELDQRAGADGTVIFRVASPVDLRLEVRR